FHPDHQTRFVSAFNDGSLQTGQSTGADADVLIRLEPRLECEGGANFDQKLNVLQVSSQLGRIGNGKDLGNTIGHQRPQAVVVRTISKNISGEERDVGMDWSPPNQQTPAHKGEKKSDFPLQ